MVCRPSPYAEKNNQGGGRFADIPQFKLAMFLTRFAILWANIPYIRPSSDQASVMSHETKVEKPPCPAGESAQPGSKAIDFLYGWGTVRRYPMRGIATCVPHSPPLVHLVYLQRCTTFHLLISSAGSFIMQRTRRSSESSDVYPWLNFESRESWMLG